MPNWNWRTIQREWLAGARIAERPERVVAAFNETERVLGHDWIEQRRFGPGGPATGFVPTLAVTTAGQQLLDLRGVRNVQPLIKKLKAEDISAFSELRAISLIRHDCPEIEAEYSPQGASRSTVRLTDFRVRFQDEPWVHIEVARPGSSDARQRLEKILTQVSAAVQSIEREFTLDVYLRREPTPNELENLNARIPSFCLQDASREELPNQLGFLVLNSSRPGIVVAGTPAGEANVPRIGRAQFIGGGGAPSRHIAVRIEFGDQRAEEFLRREGRQLPQDSPGIIMIDASGESSITRSWSQSLKRRFQPSIHTRVGATCIFHLGMTETANGAVSRIETQLLINPYARLPVPGWLITRLSRRSQTQS